MKNRRQRRFDCLAASFLGFSAVAAAQDLPRVGQVAAYGHASPARDNPGAAPAVVYAHAVHRPGATFLGLCLRDVVLGAGSRIEVRSRRDGDADVVTP